jgi:16S rRNA (cytosine967-C5)-methyltransferase
MDPELIRYTADLIRRTTKDRPADAVLREALQADTRLTAAQRREVAGAFFAYYRWRGWHDRKREIESRIAWSLELARRFQQNPFAVPGDALRAKAVPGWLAAEMDCPEPWLRALQREPRLWLRARPGQARKVATALGEAKVPKGWLPRDAVEYIGRRDLFTTELFHQGAFELQDIASQAIGEWCAPQPGETWWDACAGEGGKTLHLADLLAGRGQVFASDRADWRLARLKQRAARARIQNYQCALWDGGPKRPFAGSFDGVLVDAPCSGVGTWQRNPHARWTTRVEDVRELAALQLRLLNHAAPAVKPGGRLLYAVCTLTRAETVAVVEQFNATHPGFEPLPLRPFSDEALRLGMPPQPVMTLWPQEFGGNGMFVAAWRRKA